MYTHFPFKSIFHMESRTISLTQDRGVSRSVAFNEA